MYLDQFLNSRPSPCCLQTTACCRRAALALVLAAPRFLCHRPTCLPIREACVAIIGCLCRSATDIIGATLAMMGTTPSLLAHRPTGLPIREAILAIVRIGGWRSNRRRHRRAAQVVICAAPRLLVWRPRWLGVHSAIVGINWSVRRGIGWLCRSDTRATLAKMGTTPSLLAHRPTILPIPKAILAIVPIGVWRRNCG